MGMGTVMLAICVSIALFMNMAGYPGAAVGIINGGWNSAIQTAFVVVLGAAGISALAGTILFPNPFALFASFMIFFMGLVALPVAIFQEGVLPTEVRTFLCVLFGFLWIMAMVAWFHGGDTP
jgi:hypothetical protein